MKTNKKLKRCLILGLVISIFVMPLILAIVLYVESPAWLTYKTTNKGTLIHPPLDFNVLKKKIFFQENKTNVWKILYLSNHTCQQFCQQRLANLQRVKLALGKYNSRVEVALIQIGSSAIPITNYPISNYSITTQEYRKFFVQKKMMLGYYLIDPTERIILYYTPNTPEKNLYTDLTHLLSTSSI